MSSVDMAAIVLTERGLPPTLETVTVDDPGPDEVRVRMVASGICHTDLAAVRDARTYPILLGHEGAGIVESSGTRVKHVQPGDHVVINWLAKCGQCRRCVTDRADLCEQILGTAAPRVRWRDAPLAVLLNAGTFCPLVVVPATGAVPIRRDIPLTTAALLGCAVATGVGAALYTAKVEPGTTVAVIGAGGVGLNVVQGARLAGAKVIVAIDVDEERLAMASSFGATHIFNNRRNSPVAHVHELTNGRGVEHVFEVVGKPNLMRQGIDMLARGGILTLVGAAARDASLQFQPRRFMSQQQTLAIKRAAVAVMQRSAVTILPATPYDMTTDAGYTGDHAGIGETSLLWTVRPDLVRLDTLPRDQLLDGVLGADPREAASPARGLALAEVIVARTAEVALRLLQTTAPVQRAAYLEALGAGVRVLEHTAQQRQVQPKQAVPAVTTTAYLGYCQAMYVGDYKTARHFAEQKWADLAA